VFLVTSQVVLHELDGLKKGGSDRARASRDASRFLGDLAGRDRASLRLARCAQASDRIQPLLSGCQHCHPRRAQALCDLPARPAAVQNSRSRGTNASRTCQRPVPHVRCSAEEEMVQPGTTAFGPRRGDVRIMDTVRFFQLGGADVTLLTVRKHSVTAPKLADFRICHPAFVRFCTCGQSDEGFPAATQTCSQPKALLAQLCAAKSDRCLLFAQHVHARRLDICMPPAGRPELGAGGRRRGAPHLDKPEAAAADSAAVVT